MRLAAKEVGTAGEQVEPGMSSLRRQDQSQRRILVEAQLVVVVEFGRGTGTIADADGVLGTQRLISLGWAPIR